MSVTANHSASRRDELRRAVKIGYNERVFIVLFASSLVLIASVVFTRDAMLALA